MHAEDEQLLARLRALADRVDPPPETVREGARWAFSWRDVDAELAALVADSDADERPLAGVRAAGGPRLLAFAAPPDALELEVAPGGASHRLIGQVAPPQPARVQVRHRDGVAEVDADALGRFAVGGVPAGPVSVRCRLGGPGRAGARVLATEWFVL